MSSAPPPNATEDPVESLDNNQSTPTVTNDDITYVYCYLYALCAQRLGTPDHDHNRVFENAYAMTVDREIFKPVLKDALQQIAEIEERRRQVEKELQQAEERLKQVEERIQQMEEKHEGSRL